jgi:ABC-type glycerol-3-phosphate transport system substrate-binding protein
VSRRRFLVGTLAAGSAAALAACSPAAIASPSGAAPSSGTSAAPASPAASGGGAVQFWTQPYGDQAAFKAFYDESVANFKSATGIDVTFEQVPWDQALQRWELVMTSCETPDAADVFYPQARAKAGEGRCAPMDLTAAVNAGDFGDFNRYVPVAQIESKWQDKIIQIPWRIDARAFVGINKFWSKTPADLDEFEAMGKDIVAKNTGLEAAAAFVGGGGTTYFMLTQTGSIWDIQILSADVSKSTLDDPRWVEALTWAKRMVDARVLTNPAVSPFEEAKFLTGQAYSAIFGGYPSIRESAASTAPDLVATLTSSLMPQGPSGKQQSIASCAGFAIFENSAVTSESQQWVKFLTDPGVAIELVATAGQLSPDTAVQDQETDPWRAPFNQQSRVALGIDQPSPAWSQLGAPDGPLDTLVKAVFGDGADIATSLATAHEGVNQTLASYT